MSKNVIQLRLYVKKRRKIETSPIEKVLWFCLYAIISPAAIVLRLSNLFAYYVIFWFGANEIIFISTPIGVCASEISHVFKMSIVFCLFWIILSIDVIWLYGPTWTEHQLRTSLITILFHSFLLQLLSIKRIRDFVLSFFVCALVFMRRKHVAQKLGNFKLVPNCGKKG